MNYSAYIILYYIIGCIVCISYLIYKTLTVKDDDDFVGFFTLILFFLWPIVVPTAIFVWIKKKLKK